jgi:Inositol-pentakisphosphate 2-kinase
MVEYCRSSVDWRDKIFERNGYVLLRTNCGRVLRIRKECGTRIHPRVSIKYYNYLGSKVGRKYVAKKWVSEIDRDSKMVVERMIGRRICRSGVLMEDMEVGMYAKIRLGWAESFERGGGKRCSCPFCVRTRHRYDYCLKDLFDGRVHETLRELVEKGAREVEMGDTENKEELVDVVSEILAREPLLQRLKSLQKTYDRFGPLTLRWLYEKYFGCHTLKKKRVGIRPFTLKGSWTREKAEEFFYSYKTAMALRDVNICIRILSKDEAHGQECDILEHRGKQFPYIVKIAKIELKSKSKLGYYAMQYRAVSGRERLGEEKE